MTEENNLHTAQPHNNNDLFKNCSQIYKIKTAAQKKNTQKLNHHASQTTSDINRHRLRQSHTHTQTHTPRPGHSTKWPEKEPEKSPTKKTN